MTKVIPPIEKILISVASVLNKKRKKRLNFPAPGPRRKTQAIAPRKGGVTIETVVKLRIKFFNGISVLLTAQAMGTPVSMLIMVAPIAITMEFRNASNNALS